MAKVKCIICRKPIPIKDSLRYRDKVFQECPCCYKFEVTKEVEKVILSIPLDDIKRTYLYEWIGRQQSEQGIECPKIDYSILMEIIRD